MTELTNVDRFVAPQEDTYVFLSPTGETLQYLGVSSAVQTIGSETLPLYTFVYIDFSNTLHQLDVNKDLEVIYLDSVATIEPYDKISFSFKEVKFSIALAVNDAESKFKYDTPIHISENLALGTIDQDKYQTIEEIWKDRLLGAINLKFTRDENGLLSVQACIVNKGEVPFFS